MESRSFYEQAKELERIREMPEARPWTLEAGAIGNRKERRAQAAKERRWAKRKAKMQAHVDA